MTKRKKVFETATNAYTAQSLIGNGGAGTVHLVTDVNGAQFALKCLREADSEKRQRFRNELFFCQQDVHENIVRVLDSGIIAEGSQRLPFYVMPKYSGTLRALITNRFSPDQVLQLFDQIMSGIEAAHVRGVYHRDLKPENILYDDRDSRLVVADFGIAHFAEEDLLTAVETGKHHRLCNITYAAPEQKIRGSLVDHRADIFALGLILNEMFTGFPPLAAGHPLIASVSPSHGYLDELVRRMTLYSAGERPTSINKIKEELIGRGQAFIALQKLDELRRRVVPASAPSDPLGPDGVKVLNFEYLPGNPSELVYFFNVQPPPLWQQEFKSLTNYRGYGGAEPNQVRFYNKSAGVNANERTAREINQIFNEWIAAANSRFRVSIDSIARKQHEDRVKELQRQQAMAEEKERVTRMLTNPS